MEEFFSWPGVAGTGGQMRLEYAARYYSQVCSRNPVIVLRFNIGVYGWQGKGRAGGMYLPAMCLVKLEVWHVLFINDYAEGMK